MKAWSTLYDRDKNLGISMLLHNDSCVGFFGITKITEDAKELEVNYVTTKDYRGFNLAEKFSRILTEEWREEFDKSRKCNIYTEALGTNTPSVITTQRLGGEFIETTKWPLDNRTEVDKYKIPSKFDRETITSDLTYLDLKIKYLERLQGKKEQKNRSFSV